MEGETEQDWYFRVPRMQCGLIGQRRDPEERGKESEALWDVFAHFGGGFIEVMVVEVGSDQPQR